MTRLLARSSLNFFRRHPWQLFFAVTGIALGVAVVVAIDLAKSSALTAFDEAMRTVAGRATHRIVGGPRGLDESLYVRLRLAHGAIPTAPKVEGTVEIDFAGPETFRLTGIDFFAEPPFQPRWTGFEGKSPENFKLSRLLTQPATVLMAAHTGERLGVHVGDEISMVAGTERRTLRILGLFSPADALTRHSVSDLLIADIATAQELLGMVGRLSRIDLILDSERDAELIGRTLPPDAKLVEYGAGDRTVRQMTRAFYINISALSLLSLVVGMFLIYNTLTFMVVQRRQLIGSLRALGVTRREIFLLIVREATLIGLAGTLIGIGVGIVLGHTLLGMIAKTISEVFARLSPPLLTLSPLYLAKGFALGLFATLISALLPAIEAAAVPPLHAMSRSQLESKVRGGVFAGLAAGAIAALGGIALTFVSEKSIVLGFSGLLFIVLGAALAAPAFAAGFMALISPVLSRFFGVMGRLPPRSVVASLSRTGVAIAALMVAVATTIGMEIMVESFRFSLHQWLKSRVNADFYVSAPAPASSASETQLDADLQRRIAALEGVAHVGSVRRILLERDSEPIHLHAYRLVEPAYAGFTFTEKLDGNLWRLFEEEEAVIVSEPFAFHHDLRPTSPLPLPTDHGVHTFRVAGIYSDFNAGPGIVAMSRSTYERYWNDAGLSSLWVYGKEGYDAKRLNADLLSLAGKNLRLIVTENRAIVETSLAIFDRAFTLSEVLRALAAAIAFVGVFSALMALQLERSRELGILRASGVTPRQLWTLICTETGLMGLIAGLLAVPVGCVMAWMLIFVINRRTFGWRMDLFIAPEILLQGAVLAILAALLAGLYPAWKMARTSPAQALRNE